MPQFRTLVKADNQPQPSLSEVAEHLGASLPTASRIVAGLVTKGYLARRGCSNDRRQIELAITSRGRAVLDAAWEATQLQMESKLKTLRRAQHATLMEAMSIFREIFGSAHLRRR